MLSWFSSKKIKNNTTFQMLELSPLLNELCPYFGMNIRILGEIIKGIYCVSSGGVTMKNISRWTGVGASYRTIQRFMGLEIAWLSINITLFKILYTVPLIVDYERYILAFDEVVEDKAGKKTHGVNWFYSSIVGKVIRSVSNHVVSLVDTKREHSFPLTHKQTIKPVKKKKKKAKQSTKQEKKEVVKGKPGRPKGSKNKQNVKSSGLLYSSFEILLKKVLSALQVIGGLAIRYVVADGAYGNKTCCLIARENGLELVSKLNRNTGLYLPYAGKYSGKGRPRKYGDKLDYANLDVKYLIRKEVKDKIITKTYQIKGVWTKHLPFLVNVVIIIKTDLASKKVGRAILFSTDLELEGLRILHFYSLRFQIEFNFRDAKQYFGMSNFKNTKEIQVQNAVGLSLFMDNVSFILSEQAKKQWEEEHVSIQDLKAYYRAQKYLKDILNTLEIPENSILMEDKFADILKIGAINRTKSKVSTL